VKALVCHPARMTHASIPAEERAKLGLSDTLIRLSTGCETRATWSPTSSTASTRSSRRGPSASRRTL